MEYNCPNCDNILDFFEEEVLTCTGCRTTYELVWVQSDDYGFEPEVVKVDND